ncbi:hypothetical protein ACQ4PT_065075 [Festuca glaucescens]
MGSYSAGEVVAAAVSGAHYPALNLDQLDIKGSKLGEEQPTTSGMENGRQCPFIIGVAGGASSGKSTVCKMIIDQLCDHRVVVVTQVCVLQIFFLIALLLLYLDCPFLLKIK